MNCTINSRLLVVVVVIAVIILILGRGETYMYFYGLLVLAYAPTLVWCVPRAHAATCSITTEVEELLQLLKYHFDECDSAKKKS